MSGHTDTVHTFAMRELRDQRDALVAENQQLRAALERCATAPSSLTGMIEIASIARAALAGTPSEDTACPRCKGSGVVASVDGEAMDCDCGTPSEELRCRHGYSVRTEDPTVQECIDGTPSEDTPNCPDCGYPKARHEYHSRGTCLVGTPSEDA